MFRSFSKARFIIFAMLTMALPVMAQETFTHEPTGMEFTLPAGWLYTQEGDHFEADSPNDEVSLLFYVAQSTEAEAALEETADILDLIISDVRITADATEERVNNLMQIYMEGDGLIEGIRIDWDMTLVCGRRNSMAIIALGDIEANQRVIDRIYSSIRQ